MDEVVAQHRLHPLVRSHLHAISPYVPGRPIADVMREFGLHHVVKLASNENPLGPSMLAVQAGQQAMLEVNRYPDGAAKDLREAIAKHMSLSEDYVIVSNGSDEMIKMIAETFLDHGDEIVLPFPSFAQYTFGANVMDAKITYVPLHDDLTYDLDAMLRAISDKTKIVYLCTPNNPTGSWLQHQEIEAFLHQLPDHVLLVLDEAYCEYVTTPDPIRSEKWIAEGKPLLSLRTFSKIYGLAGLRLGYTLGHPALLAYLHKVREPFNANAVAQKTAIAALFDQEHVIRVRDYNEEERQRYYAFFEEHKLRYYPSQGNFILLDVGDGRKIFDQLQRKGIITRAGFPGLERCVRISIGTREENALCREALLAVLHK